MRIPSDTASATFGAIGLLFAVAACNGAQGLPTNTALSQTSARLYPNSKLSGEVFASDGIKQRCSESTDSQGNSKIYGVFGAIGYASGPVTGDFTVTGTIQSNQLPSPTTTLKEQFSITVDGREINGNVKYTVAGSGGGALACTRHRMRFDFSNLSYKLKGGDVGTTSVVLRRKSLQQTFL